MCVTRRTDSQAGSIRWGKINRTHSPAAIDNDIRTDFTTPPTKSLSYTANLSRSTVGRLVVSAAGNPGYLRQVLRAVPIREHKVIAKSIMIWVVWAIFWLSSLLIKASFILEIAI
jgi:hypothetical protein